MLDWFDGARAWNEEGEAFAARHDPARWLAPAKHLPDPADEAACLAWYLIQAKHIASAHGVPPHCRFEWLTVSSAAAGMAGFEDAPDSFDKPRIFLDAGILERDFDKVMLFSALLGVAVHEASHIL